mmetsp:Transcript_19034/g.38600  ORF Transcript_19034/g.38600 Transcript_19034/m.38600 type:complete len:532 (-) Transcript_19034:99-1694(-)
MDGDSEADGADGELALLLDRLLQIHKGHRVRQGILLQFLGGNDQPDRNLRQPPKRRPGVRVLRGRHLPHKDGIGRGDVLERHAHGRLASQPGVQVGDVLLGQHVGRHGADDRPVLVKETGNVDLVPLLRFRQGPVPAIERGDVAGVNVGLHGRLTGRGVGVGGEARGGHVGEGVAGLVLELRVLGEGDADGVAEAVGEEGADSHGGLHATVLALSGLCDAEVEGVIPPEAVLLGGEEAVGLNHDEGVGRLHGEHEVVVVLGAADVRELDGGFDHAAGGVAVEGQDATGKGAVIGPDAHGAVEGFALLHEGEHSLHEVLPFLGVVVLGLVHLLLEILTAICKVAGVDPNLLDGVGNQLGDDRLEVHVGAKGNVVPLLEQTLADLGACVRLPLTLNGNTDKVEPLVGASHHLLDGPLDVGGGGGGHGLTDYGVFGAEFDGTALDGAGLAADDGVEVLAVVGDGADLLVAGAGFDGGGPQDVGGGGGVRRHAKGGRRAGGAEARAGRERIGAEGGGGGDDRREGERRVPCHGFR